MIKLIQLYLEMCNGTAFDGAATMSGHLTGVATRFKELIPHAVSTHCWSHKLSLSVLGCTKDSRQLSDATVTIGEVSGYFLNHSPKTLHFLDLVYKSKYPNSSRQHALIKQSLTRWSQRILAWEQFLEVLDVVVETLEIICGDKANTINDIVFSAETRNKAGTLLTLLRKPSFSVSLVCMDKFLKLLLGPTIQLQGREMEILKAYEMMHDVINVLQDFSLDLDNLWENDIWPKVQKCSDILDIDILPPRRVGHQRHRSNVPGDGKEYFKITVGREVLDTILADLKERFGNDQMNIAKMLVITPSNLVQQPVDKIIESLSEVVEHFKIYFPDKGALFAEIPVLQANVRRLQVFLFNQRV